MIEVKELLNKFNKIFFFEGEKREIIIKTIFDVTKIKIKTEEIKIKDNIIYLNTKPTRKNEIFLKQNEIFLKLKETLGKNAPQKIN